MSLTQSSGKWGVLRSMSNIRVHFAADPPFQLQIKHAMKTSTMIQNKKSAPSLFQIAAQLEDAVPAAALKSAPASNHTPFADLMLHPDKLEAALKTAKSENDAFDAKRKFSQSPAKRVTRSATSKRFDGGGTEKPSNHSLIELKRTEFHLEAPSAGSVKLVADFTDWEKFPLDMVKSEDGVWFANVPLPPGHYPYRFIVDGEWCDDPHPALREPNPFGTDNAVMNVS